MGGEQSTKGCVSTHLDTYAIHKIQPYAHNVIFWTHANNCTVVCIIQTVILDPNQSRVAITQSQDEEYAILRLPLKKKKPGSTVIQGVTCFPEQPAVQQRFPSVPILSLFLRHRQRPDAERGRKSISVAASVNAPGIKRVAKSQSEFKLGLILTVSS